MGQIFRGDRPEDQFTAAAGLRRALAKPSGIGRHWTKRDGDVDAFDAKADALAVLAAVGAPAQALQTVPGGPAWFHPGRAGTIQIGPQNVLGHFGELHPRVLQAFDAEGPLDSDGTTRALHAAVAYYFDRLEKTVASLAPDGLLEWLIASNDAIVAHLKYGRSPNRTSISWAGTLVRASSSRIVRKALIC